MTSVGRNEPCPCGSGKKSKRCCGRNGAPETEAIIDAREGRYFSAIWFIDGDEHKRDWLAALWRDGDGPFHLTGRFRFYVDDKIHEASKDRREPFHLTNERLLSEAEWLAKIDSAADDLVRDGFGQRIHKLLVRSSEPKVVSDALAREAWMHMKTIG